MSAECKDYHYPEAWFLLQLYDTERNKTHIIESYVWMVFPTTE